MNHSKSGNVVKVTAKVVAGIVIVAGVIIFIMTIILASQVGALGGGAAGVTIFPALITLAVMVGGAWLIYHFMNAIGDAAINSGKILDILTGSEVAVATQPSMTNPVGTKPVSTVSLAPANTPAGGNAASADGMLVVTARELLLNLKDVETESEAATRTLYEGNLLKYIATEEDSYLVETMDGQQGYCFPEDVEKKA